MRIHNKKYLKENRKQLRNNSTEAEILLWLELKQSKLDGRKFRRQHSIGNYIVDFYCPLEKLSVELDGEIHFQEEQIKYDKSRDAYINSLGIKVIRFENQDVIYGIEEVLKQISKNFKKSK
ncbi:MAG: endonuclease domain-containing protein [Ignavibacteriales bacterium]|jgi:very-short-patch-repair endonuclease|nr:MAG: endonuclease domain-containing protein [Ignavibacteriales bacterium]